VTDTAALSLRFIWWRLTCSTTDPRPHQFEWWWRLHSLHHAQRQMTMWSDNRNHLLDDLLRDVIVVVVAWPSVYRQPAPGGAGPAQ
jgi:sterol desaturase/sphingolipid hydroxylase (fatty acid hydroxylase superfamily)